jgi:predicted nucleic acid-binding protein
VPAIYVDTLYYIAVLNSRDQCRSAVNDLAERIEAAPKLTSEPVFVEVLARAGARGSALRRAAVALVDAVRTDANTLVVRQTPELFDAGLDLYCQRPDKGYSLTDCMSMVVCGEHDVEDVLTHDRHFAQEGYRVLL